MKLSKTIEAYIAYKRSLGMGFRSEAVRLRAFVQCVGDRDLPQVRPQSVRRYLDGNGPVTTFWFAKYHTLAAFYRYAVARHYVRKSPLPRSRPQAPEKFQPYIYSNDDMRKLIDAADSRHRYVWLLTPDTVRTLLLLLYGTGLRISEALRLNLEDFDRDSAVLTIHETKFFKSRLVPVGPDLRRVLEVYIDHQWPPAYRTEETPLLGTAKRERILRQTAELVYKRLREEAGIHRSASARFQPRLHDFRHTFAVIRLVTWYREGKNVQRLLPHLTTYLGHGRIQDTARYLSMTTELLQEASVFLSAMPGRRLLMTKPTQLGVWVKRFLLEHLVSERNLSRNTQRSYRDTLTLFLPFASARKKKPIDHLEVIDLSREVIRDFLDHLEQSRSCTVRTRNQRLAALHAMARFIAERSPEHIA